MQISAFRNVKTIFAAILFAANVTGQRSTHRATVRHPSQFPSLLPLVLIRRNFPTFKGFTWGCRLRMLWLD